MEQETFDAVVLAGGGPDDPVARAQNQPVKALCRVRGAALVEYVVQALGRTGASSIVVATSPAAAPLVADLLEYRARVVAAAGPRFIDTLQAALAAEGLGRHVLLATGDLPALSVEAVRHFFLAAKDTGADIVYATVRADALSGDFARSKRVKVRLREGQFVGGNLVLASTAALKSITQTIERAFLARKSAVSLARLLGLGFLLRFALGWLDIPAIVRRAEDILQCSAAVVISPYPEVCFDVDRPQDIELAERILALRGG